MLEQTLGGKMLRKFLLLFTTTILLLSNSTNNSNAAILKKDKDAKSESKKKEKEVDKRIIVAEIYAGWCPGCKNIQPTIDQITKSSAGINLVKLDVSTPSKAKLSSQLAKELMISDFFDANKSKTATVGIIVPLSGEIVSIYQNNTSVEDYNSSIETAKLKLEEFEHPNIQTKG